MYEPWKVPYHVGSSPAAITDLELGARFATWMHYLTDPDGVTYAVVKAQDLGPGRQLKTYGPGHGLSMPPQPMVAADDRAARLAYVDTAMLVRRVDLDWLTTPATTHEDTSAPQLVSLGGTARVSAGPIRATWSFTDDDPSIEYGSGIVDYDVRYQQLAVGQPVAGDAWLMPSSLSGLTSTSVDLPGTSGTDTCWSVRARDHVGNVSGWTAPRCTTLDVTGPTVRMTPLPAVTTASAVAIAYAGSDPAGVASYDVRYRHATYGGTFSSYFTAASATTVTRFAVTLAARTQYCYSARARDNLGNVSAWSAETRLHRPRRPGPDPQLASPGHGHQQGLLPLDRDVDDEARSEPDGGGHEGATGLRPDDHVPDLRLGCGVHRGDQGRDGLDVLVHDQDPRLALDTPDYGTDRHPQVRVDDVGQDDHHRCLHRQVVVKHGAR